jgi:TPR repeat protein
LVFALALAYVIRNNLHGTALTPGLATAGSSEKPAGDAKGTDPKTTTPPSLNYAPNSETAPASAPPVIRQFRIEPASISTGEPATLKWDVSGADSIVIDHDVGKVSARDTSVIGPTTSTTYALTASNSAGSSHRTAFIDVQPESIPPDVRVRQLMSEAAQKRKAGSAEEAFALFSQAAELGNVTAMVEVGECYRSGDGAPQDDNKAVSWFRRAADAGNSPGMVALGVMYLFGIDGGNPNEALANQWFQKAADRGDAAGLYNLAESYEKGRGVSKSLEQAIDLYGKSARLGNAEAQKRLSKLQTNIK